MSQRKRPDTQRPNTQRGHMTEREKDERDLRILKQYEMGVSKLELMRRHDVGKKYLYKFLREALADE